MNKIFDGNYLITPEQKAYVEDLEQQVKELKDALKAVDKKLGRNQWPALQIIKQALK